MEEKPFIWTNELTKKLCQMKFEHDWLFKKTRQPWGEFYKILLKNGFPEEMTIDHVRKKWSYTWDTYRLAKRNRRKSWKYYKIFEKHYGKNATLDKFESWPDECRLKLITCIAEAKEQNLDNPTMWWTVERDLRTQELPFDCCIQDLKGLWHHLKMTFNRKHRYRLKKNTEANEWALYDTMLEYYKKYEPQQLLYLDKQSQILIIPRMKAKIKDEDINGVENEFNWTKNVTESFIQVRLQNDWLFKEKPQAWKEFIVILRNEYGFPTTLSSREACRKWATIISDYQKAKATNNIAWVYYNIFELYLGDGKLSLNPLVGWQEEWVSELIRARINVEHLFEYANKHRNEGWREVEKKLRSAGIPLDHSLLDLPEIWSYLCRTFRWKTKFKNKGILTEQWPYYEAMKQYHPNPGPKVERQKQILKGHLKSKADRQKRIENSAKLEFNFDNDDNDDYEDDMKLFHLKQKLELKPEGLEETSVCRACGGRGAAVDVFGRSDLDGIQLAEKLQVVGGIEVERSHILPSRICYKCLTELENAYKFRRKCQNADEQFRNTQRKIKLELQENIKLNLDVPFDDNIEHDVDMDNEVFSDENPAQTEKPVKREKVIRRKKARKSRYDYWKICEVCGKNTKNLGSHLDTHNLDKKYSCDVCDKKFKFKSGLIIHKAVHDPTPKKTCEVCGKTFHILAQYRKHFVYHANERKFECETCGKRFNTLDILRVHNMIHTDVRAFTCSECGKTFRTAGCVSRHRRIVHRSAKILQ